jgi:hypothetical protein
LIDLTSEYGVLVLEYNLSCTWGLRQSDWPQMIFFQDGNVMQERMKRSWKGCDETMTKRDDAWGTQHCVAISNLVLQPARTRNGHGDGSARPTDLPIVGGRIPISNTRGPKAGTAAPQQCRRQS